MGAYYLTALKYPDKEKWYMYQVFDSASNILISGMKLMEHSYILNSYTNYITQKLYYNPAHVIWLCDYHDRVSPDDITWEDVVRVEVKKEEKKLNKHLCVLYVNFDKKEYFSIRKILEFLGEDLIKNLGTEKQSKYVKFVLYKGKLYSRIIHPLPFLTNSESEYAGGGDYHGEYPLRGYWAKDLIVALPDGAEPIIHKYGFEDISKDVLVEVENNCLNTPKDVLTFYLLKLMKDFNVVNNPSQFFLKWYSTKSPNEYYITFPRVNEKKVIEILKSFS